MCADGVEATFDVLVATVYLVDMVDAADAVRRHGGDEHGNTRADVWGCHVVVAETHLAVMSDNDGAVGVAKDNLRAHVNEFVHKEETALEHLLMYEDRAARLRRHHQDDGKQVGRQSGPRCIGDGEDGAVDKRLYLIVLLRGDVYVVTLPDDGDAKSAESLGDDAEIAVRDIADGEFAARERRHADERTDLNHIRKKSVVCAVERLYTVDSQQIGADTFDTCSHAVEHAAELPDVGFASGIVDGGGTLRQDGSHDDVRRTRDTRLIEQHVLARKLLCLKSVGCDGVVVGEGGTEVEHALEMGIQTAAAYLVPPRLGIDDLAETRQKRSDEHDRATQFGAFLKKEFAFQIVGIQFFGAKSILAFLQARDLHADGLEEVNQVIDIEDVGDVADNDLLAGEQSGTEDLQRLVFRPLRGDAAVEFVTSFYDKCGHISKCFKFQSFKCLGLLYIIDFGGEGDAEAGADRIDDLRRQLHDIGGRGSARIDNHKRLFCIDLRPTLRLAFPTALLNEPRRGNLDATVHRIVGDIRLRLLLRLHNLREMRGSDNGVLEETAGRAKLLRFREFLLADADNRLTDIQRRGVSASQGGADVAILQAGCGLFAQTIHHACHDILTLEFGFENAVAVGVAAFGIGENAFAARGDLDGVHLRDEVLRLHAIGTDILHRRRADLARDVAQILQAIQPHIRHLRNEFIQDDARPDLNIHRPVVLAEGTGEADAGMEDNTIEILGKQQVRACSDVENPLPTVAGEQVLEFGNGGVFHVLPRMHRNAKCIWDWCILCHFAIVKIVLSTAYPLHIRR